MTIVGKGIKLFFFLPRHPFEFFERVKSLLEIHFEPLWVKPPIYQPSSLEEVLLNLEQFLNVGMQDFISEPPLTQIEIEIRERMKRISSEAPFSLAYNADFALARFGYIVCRAMKPSVVLETGVAYGVSSAFILQALHINNHGILYSVDLPPLGKLGQKTDYSVGILIPEALKVRWQLLGV